MSRILGIDHGGRRIGLAIADEGGVLAVPLRAVEYKSETEFFEILKKIIMDESIARLVIGMPLTLKGEKGTQAKIVEAFAERLKSETRSLLQQRPSLYKSSRIIFIDERMTTRIGGTDAGAAAEILQTYLDRKIINPKS